MRRAPTDVVCTYWLRARLRDWGRVAAAAAVTATDAAAAARPWVFGRAEIIQRAEHRDPSGEYPTRGSYNRDTGRTPCCSLFIVPRVLHIIFFPVSFLATTGVYRLKNPSTSFISFKLFLSALHSSSQLLLYDTNVTIFTRTVLCFAFYPAFLFI